MRHEPDIELVVIDTDHFLDTYRDVVDFEHPDTANLDGNDLGDVLDFNIPLLGLSQRPLTDWFHWRAGSQDLGMTNDVVTMGHDTDTIQYEYKPVLDDVEQEFPEPEIEAIMLRSPDVELVVVDSDHFLERYQDIYDFTYTGTPDLDGNDLGSTLDLGYPIQGLVTKPLTHFLDTYTGDGTGMVAWSGEFPDGFDLDVREYETPPTLSDVSVRFPEPVIEAVDLTPEIEFA